MFSAEKMEYEREREGGERGKGRREKEGEGLEKERGRRGRKLTPLLALTKTTCDSSL